MICESNRVGNRRTSGPSGNNREQNPKKTAQAVTEVTRTFLELVGPHHTRTITTMMPERSHSPRSLPRPEWYVLPYSHNITMIAAPRAHKAIFATTRTHQLSALATRAMTSEPEPPRNPIPPFSYDDAVTKVRMAENAWNTRDPQKVSMAYSPDTQWRNRDTFLQGREEVREFLSDKWKKEQEYREQIVSCYLNICSGKKLKPASK